jgi:hypothetical protein
VSAFGSARCCGVLCGACCVLSHPDVRISVWHSVRVDYVTVFVCLSGLATELGGVALDC